MRSSISILAALFIPVVLTTGAIASGCASVESAGATIQGAGEPTPTASDVDAADASMGVTIAMDAGVKNTSRYTGSPLCHADDTTCFPDSVSATSDAGTGIMCGPTTGADDAGPTSVDSAMTACRVRDAGSGGIPSCTAAGSGAEGASCKSGAECAPGLDCVGDGNSGTCRRYCCAGDCSGQGSGTKTFCDIVSLNESTSSLIPACVPVQTCTLLDTTSCPDKETCSIVSSDGTASCVPIGGAGPGQSCDETHCAEGLMCIGQPGTRQCFQLCKMSNAACPANTSCKENALFAHDPSIGICQPE